MVQKHAGIVELIAAQYVAAQRQRARIMAMTFAAGGIYGVGMFIFGMSWG